MQALLPIFIHRHSGCTGPSGNAPSDRPSKTVGSAFNADALGPALLASLTIHVCLLLLGPAIFSSSRPEHRVILPITLVELPSQETPVAQRNIAAPAEIAKRKPPPPRHPTRPVEQPVAKRSPTPELRETIPTTASKRDAAEAPKNYPFVLPIDNDPVPSSTKAAPATVDDSGAAGIGVLVGDGRPSGVAGTGSVQGNPAALGPGRGAGAPGLAAPSVFRTQREAKPIKSAPANYPPMALRAGLESDVTLRIEVDTEGKVTKAEILKSGGPGFDEEALRAVKQSRFEPAEREGKAVTAELTYIYRFRLQR